MKHNHPRIVSVVRTQDQHGKKFWTVSLYGSTKEPVFEKQTVLRTMSKNGNLLKRPIKETVDVQVGTKTVPALIERKVWRRSSLRKLGVAV